MTPGQKIRALRKEKNITQSALTEGEITRNMLSRIESDKAQPSLSTLLFLAEKLDVSAGYLLDETATLFDDKKARFFPRIKHAFSIRNYKEVLRLYEKHLGECDDEIALLLAESYTALTEEALHNGKMTSAQQFAQKGLAFTAQTTYATHHLEASLTLYLAILSNIQSPKYEVQACAFPAMREKAIREDLYHYASEYADEHTFSDPYYQAHADAKRLISLGRYADALKALEEIENKRMEKGFSVFVLFRIYSDLELCHKELRNFEAAYRYSAKKLSLLSAFRA